MKRLLLSFFFSLAMLYLPAQNTKTYQFEKGIGGIEFTGFNILGAVPNGDGTRVFMELSRVGAIQAKTGPLMSGGNDPVTIKALGVIDLAADQGVEQEVVRWLKPDNTPRQFNILEAPGKILGDPLATQDDCVELRALVSEYPEIRLLFGDGPATSIEPYSYYQNYMNYTMLGKPKNIELRHISVNAEGNKDYDEQKIEFENESYRGSTKTDYWVQIESTECDEVTGNFWVYNGRLIRKEYNNRSNMYLQELVVYDKAGEELNRSYLEFEKPQLLLRSQYFYGNADGQDRVLGKAHVYGEAYGFGYKKLNPEPNETRKQFFEWDENGKLIQEVTFEAPHEDFDPLFINKGAEKTTLLAEAGDDVYVFEFVGGALAASNKLSADNGLVKNTATLRSVLQDGDLSLIKTMPLGENIIQIYSLTKVVSPGAGQAPVRNYYGDVFFLVDKKGNLLNANALTAAPGESSNRYNFYPSGNNLIMVVSSGEKNVKVVKATSQAEFEALYVSNPENLSTAAAYLEENNRLVITQLTPKKVVEIQIIDL